MSSNKDKRNQGIVPAGNRGLTKYSSVLIQRGLDLAKELDQFQVAIEIHRQKTEITKPQTWRCVATFSKGSEFSISPDGQILAISGHSEIKLWRLDTGKCFRTMTWNSIPFSSDEQMLAKFIPILESYSSFAISPDGQTKASGGHSGTISLLPLGIDIDEIDEEVILNEHSCLTGHSRNVYSVAFSPDSQILASGSRDETIKLWQLSTRTEICTLTGHSNSVYCVAFSPDGQTLASGSSDNTIKLWNLDTGKEIRTFAGNSSSVNCVAFSPDGQTLASGSVNGTIKLWQLSTGIELQTLWDHTEAVNCIAFSSDGQTFASRSANSYGTIKIWRLSA